MLKFKTKITLTFLAIGIFSISLLVAVSLLFNARHLKSTTIQLGDELAMSSARALSGYFETRKAELSTYANMPLLRTMNWQDIGPFLEAEQKRHNGIYEKMLLGLPDSPGHYYITTEGNPYFGGLLSFDNSSPAARLKSIGKRDYWQHTAGNNSEAEARVYVSNPMVSYFTGVRQIMVAASILSENSTKVLGMVSGSIAWAELERKIHDIQKTILHRFGEDARMFLVSHDGTYVYHYDQQKAIHLLTDSEGLPILNTIGEKTTITHKITEESSSEIASAGEAMLAAKAGNINFVDQKTGERKYLFFAPVDAAGYGLGLVVAERIIMHPLQNFYFLLTIIAVVALGLIGFFSYFVAKKATEPLTLISQKATELCAGNWNARIDYSQEDELGVVALSFNSMIDKLQKQAVTVAESHERLLTILDGLDAIVYVADMNTYEVIFTNMYVQNIFGDITGKICWQTIQQGQDGPCPFCTNDKLLTAVGEPAPPYTWEFQNTTNGRWYYVIDRAVKWLDGRTVRLEIATDITDMKKAEEDLLQAHKMEAVGTLAGGIAHDFNNILTAIIGFAEIAKYDISEGGSPKNNIEQVLIAANRAKELVQQILTFSRKGGKTKQLLQPSSSIKEAIKFMRASLPTTIEIQEEIDPDCGSILANPTNIHQILVNLCTNALHAMENEKGILQIKLTRVELTKRHNILYEDNVVEGAFVVFMVRDTGQGMDKKTVDRIFDPYFTTKAVGKGSGMGLALVYGIVHDCGGFIKVESEPAKGTTFYVYFPAMEEKPGEVEEEQLESFPKGNERILAVDDDEVIVGLYQATLERLGYKVSSYCSSEKALEVFHSAPDSFDLIITDQTMPHLTGSELAQKILQIRPNIPIILCTGYSAIVSEKQAKEIGIASFVMKPVSMKVLAITVREVLIKSKS